MTRTLHKAATDEQLKKVIEKLVEDATNESNDPNVRVKAAGLFLNTMLEYPMPAGSPLGLDG